MRSAVCRGHPLGIALTAAVVMLAAPAPSFASGGRLEDQAVIADRQAQQIQLPHIDFDPKKWAEDALSAVLQDLSDGIRAGMHACGPQPSSLQTPPSLTYQNADVRGLYTTMQRIANAALAVIATIGALNTILRPHLGFRYHSLSAFVHRLLVDAILVKHGVLVGAICD
jgi:hypothetical protein